MGIDTVLERLGAYGEFRGWPAGVTRGAAGWGAPVRSIPAHTVSVDVTPAASWCAVIGMMAAARGVTRRRCWTSGGCAGGSCFRAAAAGVDAPPEILDGLRRERWRGPR